MGSYVNVKTTEPLDQCRPIELSVKIEKSLCTSHVLPLTTWNTALEEVSFEFCLVSIHLNPNTYIWLVATLMVSTALEDNIRQGLHELGIGKVVLNRTQEDSCKRRKLIKIKMKNLWSLEDIIKKVKGNAKLWCKSVTKDSHPKYINKIHTLTEKSNNLILKIAKDFKTCYKRNLSI